MASPASRYHNPDGSGYDARGEGGVPARLTVELNRLDRISFHPDLPPPGMADVAGIAQRTWHDAQQLPYSPNALGKAVRPDHYHIEQAIVWGNTGSESDEGRDDFAAVGHEDHGGVRLVFNAIYGNSMHRASDFRDKAERGGHIGSHAPSSLVLREGACHDPRIVSCSAGHGEILRPARPLHPAQVELLGSGTHQRSCGTRRRGRNSQVPRQQIPSSTGDYSQCHIGAHQRRGRLHRGAVPTENRDYVYPVGHAVFSQDSGIARPAGGQDLGLPPGAPQRAHDGGDRQRVGPRRRRVGDDQRPGHT